MASEAEFSRYTNAVLFANGVDGVSRFEPDVKLAGLPGSRTLLVFFNNADPFYARPESFTRWRRRVCIHRYDGGTGNYHGFNRGDVTKMVFALPPMFIIHREEGAKDGFYADPVKAEASSSAPCEKRMTAAICASVERLPETTCGATTGYLTAMALRSIIPGEIVLVGFNCVQPWSVGSHAEDAEHRVLAESGFTFMEY